MKLKTTAKLLTNLIPSALLSFSLIYALTTSLNFTFSIYAIMLFTAVPFVLLPVIFMSKTSMKISAFLAVLAIVGTTAYFLISKGWDIVYYYIQVFFIWIFNFMNDAQSYNAGNALICVIFISIVVSLCVYIFTVRRLRFPLLFISGVGLFAIQGIFNFFSSLAAFYIFCIMMIFYYMKHIHKKNSAVDKNEYAGQMGFLYSVLPLVILIGVLTFFLPASREPVHWKWLDKQYDALMKMLENPSSDPMVFDVFSLSSTGFGEQNNILGGKVKLNKTPVLKVESPRRLYLKGVIKNIYTGKAWLSTVENKLPLNDSNNTILDNDIEETMSHIIGIDQSANVQSDESVTISVDGGKTITLNKKYSTSTANLNVDYSKYMYKDRVTVTFDNLIVRSIFLPLKANNIKFNEKNVRFDITKSGLVTTPTPIKKGFKYSFDVYTPKYNNEEVLKLLRKSKPGIIYEQYKSQIDSLSEMFGYQILTPNQSFTNYVLNEKVTDQTLLNYLEMFKITNQLDYLNNIYSLNLKVPETIPQRVKDLANRITSGCNNNYDKVKAIEKYLNDNYRYTLEPPDTPKNRDFVDYFLFDSKKGYCTYFASSMSILTRCLGIPSRYVEGYMMPSKKNSQGNYTVTNEQAHAWVEVYFEGFGWVPFEATPAFYSSFYNKNSDSRLSDEMVKNPNYSEYVEYLRRLAMSRDNMNLDNLADQEADKQSIFIIILEIVFIAVVALFVFILSFNFFRRKLKLIKLLKMTPEEGAKGLYNYYLNILSIMGYPVEPGETPFDYSKRLYGKIDFLISSEVNYEDRLNNRGRIISELHKPKYDFAKVTNLVVKAIYDKRGITAEERDTIFEYSHFLHESAKKYFGKNSYFVKVYILGKFKV